MFTGLIKEKGAVISLTEGPAGARLAVAAPLLGQRAALGDSIAVNGACLTVADKKGDRLVFDVSRETLKKTTIGGLRPGAAVNLEDSLTPSAPLGGHFVQGHVDGVGRVAAARKSGGTALLSVRVPGGLARYLVPKGSVAVDGVSLTVNEVRGAVFTVTLVPHTLVQTILASKRRGNPVNIEADILAKTVAHLLDSAGGTGKRPSAGERRENDD
jgi:riboflavin synthase